MCAVRSAESGSVSTNVGGHLDARRHHAGACSVLISGGGLGDLYKLGACCSARRALLFDLIGLIPACFFDTRHFCRGCVGCFHRGRRGGGDKGVAIIIAFSFFLPPRLKIKV